MKRLFMMTALIMCSAGVFSQTDSVTTLNDVVVTANRFPQKQQQTGKVLTVIPRSILEKSTGKNLGELLNQYAGLTIIGANNNPGTNIDVYTRGAGLGNTLILVDGVPIYDVSSISSAFDLNFFTPDMVERIEILKGGQSTVYGSDAVAGVINIIPRKSAKKPLQGNLTAAAGSFGTAKLGAGISGAKKDLNYNLQYQFLRTEGLSAALDTFASKEFDKDGLTQHNINAGFNGKFNERLSWKLMGQANIYKAELDAGAFGDDADNTVDNKNYMAGASLIYQLSKTTLHANYNFNYTRRYYYDDSASIGGFSKFSTSDYRGLSHFTELYANTTLNEHFSFITGIDARFQKTDQDFLSISDYGPFENNLSRDSAKIDMYSAYASVFLNTGKGFFMEAGSRLNHHSLYGSNLTYTLNPSFVTGRWKFFFNLSTAFKAPTLFQLYDAFSGYPFLKPERSTSYEGGVQFSVLENTFQTRVVAFARKLKDGIDYSFVDYRYFNNNRATDKGIEVESMYRKNRWNITFNYTYLTGEVNTVKYKYDPNSYSYIPDGDTTYNYQFRRPRHSVNVFAGYQFTEKFFASAHARIVGKRFEPRFMDEPIKLDGYTVFDIYGEYRFSKNIRLFLDVKNLFDADYIDINGFTTRPVNFVAGVVVVLR